MLDEISGVKWRWGEISRKDFGGGDTRTAYYILLRYFLNSSINEHTFSSFHLDAIMSNNKWLTNSICSEKWFHTMIISIVYDNIDLHLLSNLIYYYIQITNFQKCKLFTKMYGHINNFFMSFDFYDLPPQPQNSFCENIFLEKIILTFRKLLETRNTHSVKRHSIRDIMDVKTR